MTSLLSNLIDRHQDDGGLLNADNKVQPRPKSRFETEPVVTAACNDLTANHQWAENNIQPDSTELSDNQRPHTKVAELATENTPLSIEPSTLLETENSEKQIDGPHQDEFFHDVNEPKNTLYINEVSQPTAEDAGKKSLNNQPEGSAKTSISSNISNKNSLDKFHELSQRIETLSAKLGQQQNVANQDKAKLSIQNYEEPNVIPGLNQNPDQPPVNHLAVQSELNTRIQAILHRLHNQQPGQTDSKTEIDPAKRTNDFEASHKDPIIPKQVIVQSSITSMKPGREISENPLTENRQTSDRDMQQSGMLQAPTWLTAMQAELNNRWKHSNTNPETDQVVNVTIGRVEVKAVQANSTTKPKSRNKPSGVMSLDDYLKQRQRRGNYE